MSADSSLEVRIRTRLADLETANLLRVMRPPFGVDLSSNDYLTLSTHPRITAAFAAGVSAEGAGSTGSRLLRGARRTFDAVEQQFAAFKGTERALFLSSGYLANIAALTTLPETGDVIFSDALNHASLIDGARLSRADRVVFPHSDVAALANLIDTTPCAGTRFVVVESLFSMDGDEAPLAAYAELCRRTGAALIVDDAHAVGVYGEKGSGLVEAAGVSRDVLLSINPAGKALGVGGAFLAGPAWVVEYLVQRARPFVFSTAPPPAMGLALSESLRVIHDEPERRAKLRALSSRFRAQLADAGYPVLPGTSHIVPVVIGSNEAALAVAAALQSEGFDVRAIRPPTVPAGTARLRVSVNTGLDDTTLDRFVRVLEIAAKEMSACSPASS